MLEDLLELDLAVLFLKTLRVKVEVDLSGCKLINFGGQLVDIEGFIVILGHHHE